MHTFRDMGKDVEKSLQNALEPDTQDVLTQEQKMGKRLKEMRTKKKLSLRALAAKAQVSYSELSRIECGHSFPSANMLRKLSPHLSVPIDELLFMAGYNFQFPGDQSVYLNFDGEIIDMEQEATNMYCQDTALFLQLTDWYRNYNTEDAQILICLLRALKSEHHLLKDTDRKMSKEKSSHFLKLMANIKSLIQICDYFLPNPKKSSAKI